MTEVSITSRNSADRKAGPDPRRWLLLAIIAIAQLMVMLDATIVNIALPSTQKSLGFSSVDRQWVVTAYALAFGSLLLFGGRLGDLIGRKITFLGGLIGFAAASAGWTPVQAQRQRDRAAGQAAQVRQVFDHEHPATRARLIRRPHRHSTVAVHTYKVAATTPDPSQCSRRHGLT